MKDETKEYQMKKFIIAFIVAGTLLGAACTSAKTTEAPKKQDPTSVSESISDADILDVTLDASPALVKQFCSGYDTLKTYMSDDEIFAALEKKGAFSTFSWIDLSHAEIFAAISDRC
jgi:hypothetical protein